MAGGGGGRRLPRPQARTSGPFAEIRCGNTRLNIHMMAVSSP